MQGELRNQLIGLDISQHVIDRLLREKELKWMPWGMARAMLVMAGMLDAHERPTLLMAWCASGKLQSRARNLFVDGTLTRDHPLDESLWRAVQHHPLAMRLTNDSFRTEFEIDGRPIEVRAREIEVSFEGLRALMQWDEAQTISALERARALFAPLRAAHAAKSPAQPSIALTPIPKRAGGAKRNQAAWDSFWMAVVELAVENKLSVKYFPTQVELRAEILAMTKDQMKERTIKDMVSQIWRKWVEPTA